MKIDLSPTAVVAWVTSLFIGMTFISTTMALSGHGIQVNENQILYLFSTSAQVVAAVYGLTLTGFIFFRNELSREELEDETLADAVENLKARYFKLLVFITVLVTLTLLLANLAIAHEGSGEPPLNVLILNAGQSAFLTSLGAIAYFVFDVIAPKRIERASRKIQSEVDPAVRGQAAGSLEEFLKNYNEIESLLEGAGARYQVITQVIDERRYRRRIPNARLAEILLRSERIDESLFERLRELITLRNSIIHGAEPVVSQAIVDASVTVLQQLKSALGTGL